MTKRQFSKNFEKAEVLSSREKVQQMEFDWFETMVSQTDKIPPEPKHFEIIQII